MNDDDHFDFLGFYIVGPDLRGRGYGMWLWQAASALAGARTMGLDAAVALAKAHGLSPVLETARMYSGPVREIAVERIFGVTSFELG